MAETGTGVPADDVEPPEEEFTNQTAYLNAIHLPFVELVYPIESNLVDHLRANGVFDSEDEDNIRAEKSRKNRARQCWNRLTRVPPERFHSHCFPALKAACPFAVQGKTFRWDGRVEGCLRHLLKRVMPLRRFADMFPCAGGCTHEEYRKITEGSDFDNALWDRVFELCCSNKDNLAFRTMMRTTLESIEVPVPADLHSLLAGGFPCACPKTGTKRKKSSKKKGKEKKPCKKFKVDHRPTTNTRQTEGKTEFNASANEIIPLPQGPPTAATKEQRPTSGSGSAADDPSSDATGGQAEEERQKAEEEEDEGSWFESVEQKETFLTHLDEINETITKASSMKAVFHKVSGIQMALSALTVQTRGEASEETGLRDKGKTLRLHAKIRDIRETLQSDYEAALRIVKKMEMMRSDAKLPFKFKSALQERRELLVSELTEAETFYSKSCDIFNELNVDNTSQLKAENSGPDIEPNVGQSHYPSVGGVMEYVAWLEMDQYIDDSLAESEVESLYDEIESAPEELDFIYENVVDDEENCFESQAEIDEDNIAWESDHIDTETGEYSEDADDDIASGFHDGEDDIDFIVEEDAIYFNNEEDDIDLNEEDIFGCLI